MSLGSRIEAFTKKATSHIIKNTRGIPLKATAHTVGLMIAGGIGMAAFQDPSIAGTVQEVLGGRSLEVGSKMSEAMAHGGFGAAVVSASTLAATSVSKLLGDPIGALERWSNNDPTDIIKKASWKELKKEGSGQSYIKERLESMSPVDRKQLSDYIDSGYKASERLGHSAFKHHGVDITPGVNAYEKAIKAEMGNDPKQTAKKDFKGSELSL